VFQIWPKVSVSIDLVFMNKLSLQHTWTLILETSYCNVHVFIFFFLNISKKKKFEKSDRTILLVWVIFDSWNGLRHNFLLSFGFGWVRYLNWIKPLPPLQWSVYFFFETFICRSNVSLQPYIPPHKCHHWLVLINTSWSQYVFVYECMFCFYFNYPSRNSSWLRHLRGNHNVFLLFCSCVPYNRKRTKVRLIMSVNFSILWNRKVVGNKFRT